MPEQPFEELLANLARREFRVTAPATPRDTVIRDNTIRAPILQPEEEDWSWGKVKKSTSMFDPSDLILPLRDRLSLESQASSKEQSVVGVEIENEFITPVVYPNVRGWKVTNDGSLRYHGVEFVSTPMNFNDMLPSLLRLTTVLSQLPVQPTNSIRTSTHVHFDVSHYSFIEVLVFASVYWTLEGFLSDYCGEHRKGNLFCLRLTDAMGVTAQIHKLLKRGVLKDSGLFLNDYRYGSVNFAAIRKFGTLEFRMMRGTFEYEAVETWLLALESIRQFALKFKTPAEFREYFLDKTTAKYFPEEVFGKSLFKKLNVNPASDIEANVRYCFSAVDDVLGFCSFDFTKELEALKKAAEEAKEAERRRREAMYAWTPNVQAASTFNEEEDMPVVDGSVRTITVAINSMEDV